MHIAKSVISKLLVRDPHKRMTIENFLRSDWVQGKTATTTILDNSLKRLRQHISNKTGC